MLLLPTCYVINVMIIYIHLIKFYVHKKIFNAYNKIKTLDKIKKKCI